MVYLGGLKTKFWMLLLGRIIFGLGGESMCVAQSALIADWFKGKELAFSYGLNISFARLGSVFQSNTVPIFYANHSLSYAFFAGFLVCCFAVLCTIGMVIIDKLEEKRVPRPKEGE